MACLYPSYLKQSLGQTLLYKIFSHPKTFLFPLTSQKKYIHYLSISFPVVYFVTCIFKINFYKNLKFIIGAEATN
jgi:hypothetical protein